MEEVVTGLQTPDKLSVLLKFNKDHQTFSSEGLTDQTIDNCLGLIFHNLDDLVIQEELLLCCKTVVRDKRVSAAMTPQLFVRLLEIAQLANIHAECPFDTASLQARRAVFNITYHNTNCQAACFEAQADLNLFSELLTYDYSKTYDVRLISCKMAFLFTAVSEPMRNRVIEHNAIRILHDIMLKTVYDKATPHSTKIGYGRKRNVKLNSITLSEEDLVICADVFMAVFNVTLHWDKNSEQSVECTSDVQEFVHLAKCIYEGLALGEKNDNYQKMVTKFLPILINAAAQFSDLFLPHVDASFKGAKHMGRDMTLVKALLKQLENEGSRKSGNIMVMISLLSILNKLTGTRECRKYLRKEILPPLGKVTKRPEEETHLLKSKVVKLMTHVDNTIAVLTSELLFVICKYNVERMIKYTGYGNAAGLFNRHGLLGGKRKASGDMSADDDSDTEEYKDSAPDVDLVTAGPARENTALLNMTQEEKETEANKLLNLIDDMHRKGVIKPGNIGPDGNVVEMDVAAQLAQIPDEKGSDESEDEDLGLDSNSFFPRKKPT